MWPILTPKIMTTKFVNDWISEFKILLNKIMIILFFLKYFNEVKKETQFFWEMYTDVFYVSTFKYKD